MNPRFLSFCTRLALIILGCGGFAPSAHAAMTFCNRSQNPIEAALGRRDGDVWTSQGWWKLDAGQCAKVLGGALTERFYFYYALSMVRTDKDKPPFTWSGKYQFCTQDTPFQIEGDGDCESKGAITRGFQQVDIGINTRDYTLDFKDGVK